MKLSHYERGFTLQATFQNLRCYVMIDNKVVG
jgi:hypothetical protein